MTTNLVPLNRLDTIAEGTKKSAENAGVCGSLNV